MPRPPWTQPVSRCGAAAVLVLALAACGDDAEAPPSDSGASGTAEPPTSPTPTPSRTRPPKPTPSESEEETAVEVTVEGDQVSPNAELLEVGVGEPVTLEITSNRAGELHVHTSPDQYVQFGPGRSTKTFTIERPGSVEVEEHDTGALVLRVLAQ